MGMSKGYFLAQMQRREELGGSLSALGLGPRWVKKLTDKELAALAADVSVEQLERDPNFKDPKEG